MKQLETSKCVNYSMWNPKHSAKYVCRTGTSAIVCCTCGHFLRGGTKENKRYLKFTLDLFSIPKYYIKKGRPHGHRYGKKEGDHEYFIANSLKKKCKKRDFLGIHDRFIRDERFRKSMIELGRTEEVCREMDKLANEDHTHTTLLQKKLVCTATIGGSVRILLVPTRCPQGIELISKKHCPPCDASRIKRIRLITKIGKALPHLGGTGKILGGILHLSITATMNPALIDRGNLIDGDWANYSWNESQN